MSPSLSETLRTYLEAGGFVMPPLVVMTLVLWYMVGVRVHTLRRGSTRSLRSLVAAWRQAARSEPHGVIDRAVRHAVRVTANSPRRAREILDDALFPYYQEVKRGRSTIAAIVAAAPLVGLLGTVAGMIETFDSLGDMSLHSQSGGVAGGISQALFSTQLGLCVAVPGVIAGRLLDRRQRQLEDELGQLKAHLGGDV